jgi:hypothetical protein
MNFKDYLEESDLSEATDLSKFASEMAKLTDRNDHGAARLLAAKLAGDKRLIKIVQAINIIIDLEGHNPISQYAYSVYQNIMKVGNNKFGDEWETHIRSNM